MKKIIPLLLLNLFTLNSYCQIGNINIKKPKLDVTYPDAKVEIGKKKDKEKPAEKDKENSTKKDGSNTASTPTNSSSSSNEPKSGSSTSPAVESKQDKYAKEETYWIEMKKFIAPYRKFLDGFDFKNVTSKEQIEAFKQMDYDLFKVKNDEVKTKKPVDDYEFYQNENKYVPSNAFKAVEKFYEREFAAIKNGGISPDQDYPSIKEILLNDYDNSFKQLKELQKSETAKYYDVDKKITLFEEAIPLFEFWTGTDHLNDEVVKTNLAEMKKWLANLKQIKASGADKAYHDKKEKEYKAASMAKIKISPAAMSNASYEAKAKAKVERIEKCTVKKVVITGSSWYIAKNDFGIPLDKSIPVEVAFTKDGKCFLLYGYMVKDYAGGGTYQEDVYFSYSYGSWDEMFCENIK